MAGDFLAPFVPKIEGATSVEMRLRLSIVESALPISHGMQGNTKDEATVGEVRLYFLPLPLATELQGTSKSTLKRVLQTGFVSDQHRISLD